MSQKEGRHSSILKKNVNVVQGGRALLLQIGGHDQQGRGGASVLRARIRRKQREGGRSTYAAKRVGDFEERGAWGTSPRRDLT